MTAVLANFVTDFGQFVVNCLAVAGGAAVGGFGIGWLVNRLCAMLVRRPLPRPALIAIRLLGAVAGGLLIALFVFNGPGGWGLGGGWGSGGIGKGETTDISAGKVGIDKATKPSTAKTEAESPRADRVRVQMLGGARVQGRAYYRVEGESAARTLAELQQLIRAKQPASPGVTILIYEDSIAANLPPVRDLEEWARGEGMAVDVERLPKLLPP